MVDSSKNSRGVSVIYFAAILAALFCLFTIAPKAALAQSSSTGTVSGAVVDPSNAIVAGATVTLTNTATSAARTAASNNEGKFIFAYVNPGTYTVTVAKTGFETTVVSNQVVQVGLQLTVNVTLQVGATSTTVEVTSTPGAELQTMNATVGSSLSGAIIMNLPNQSRDASTLAVLQPGQNINGNTGGVATDQNSFQLDGGFATDDMSGDNNTYIASFGSDTAGGAGAYHSSGFTQAPSAVVPMPVSSIEEFKVSTANQTADFNGGAGSQVQLVTKRGTSAFHGSVYEYYLDNNFGGANTWDNNSTGKKQPSSHFSRFGAAAGGEIPHLNVLGGNWFIFGNYEGFRYPQNSVFEENFPLPSMRAGIIHMLGQTINLNPTATTDPGCGTVTAGCRVTTANGYTPGASIPTTICPSGTSCDPRTLGINPVIQTLWSTYLPLPNDCTHGDGLNYCGYKGSISTPQSSNFGVARIDHDFAKNWHFNATYHYYKLSNLVSNQWDIGGFFPGDKLGQYSAIRQKPQVPWIYTAGLTTDISSSVTNDLHFSYTRNWWAYGSPSGVPNVAGYPAALEIGGETSNPFGPYNTNNQSTRTRYWNGHDTMFRDDVTWIKGNHLFQLGGMYLRANDTHNRNDNGESINTFEQYLVGDGNGTTLAGLGIDMTGNVPAGITGGNANKYGNLYSEILGMVDQTQSLYTRGLGSLATGLPLDPRTSCAITGIAATSGCISSPSLTNNSIIPTYNGYFTDSWHMKPTFSLNYGLGYTVEMPPYETQGGVQTVMVDQNDNILYAQKYLDNVKAAALQGNAYAPLIGFATVRNVNGHSHYPYDPFFGGLSPRIGMAWNLRPDTVVRAGYSRIFGRINGVNPILVPMLTPGLLQPATCGGPNRITGGCGGATGGLAPVTDIFRVGVDCPSSGACFAPLPAPSANLPQPWYPGFNDVATGAGETIDPNFKPNRSDEFTVSVQHQFGPKILAEAGYIGRILSNEIQYYSLTSVPYMMTRGGQTFANAWAQIMEATNYGTNVPSPSSSAYLGYINGLAAQPFFENSLTPGYCNGSALGSSGVSGTTSCTAQFVAQNVGLMNVSDAFDAWGGVSNTQNWTFGRSFTSDPVPSSPFGANGQTPSLLTTVSNGYGNYNAGYLQLTFSDWHGLTMKTNFSYSNALGTGDVVQASSSYATVDPFNIQNNYGPQYYNEKFTMNLFLNYVPPFYRSQEGVIGRLLGGWSFSPLFVYGSGFPVQIGTANGDCGSLGECNTAFTFAYENGVITKNLNYSGTKKAAVGSVCGTGGAGFNIFSNPDATCPQGGGIFGDPVRSPVLGLDGQIGGGGPVKGLPFWNLDLGITKKVNFTERINTSLYFDFTNVTNHMQAADPSLNIYDPTNWGVLGGGGNLQANQPRRLQLGVSVDW